MNLASYDQFRGYQLNSAKPWHLQKPLVIANLTFLHLGVEMMAQGSGLFKTYSGSLA